LFRGAGKLTHKGGKSNVGMPARDISAADRRPGGLSASPRHSPQGEKAHVLKNGQGPGLFNRHQRSSAGSAIAAPITMLTQRLHQARHQAALGIVDRQFEPFARTACAKAQRRQFT
jgi:hypothetical protein